MFDYYPCMYPCRTIEDPETVLLYFSNILPLLQLSLADENQLFMEINQDSNILGFSTLTDFKQHFMLRPYPSSCEKGLPELMKKYHISDFRPCFLCPRSSKYSNGNRYTEGALIRHFLKHPHDAFWHSHPLEPEFFRTRFLLIYHTIRSHKLRSLNLYGKLIEQVNKSTLARLSTDRDRQNLTVLLSSIGKAGYNNPENIEVLITQLVTELGSEDLNEHGLITSYDRVKVPQKHTPLSSGAIEQIKKGIFQASSFHAGFPVFDLSNGNKQNDNSSDHQICSAVEKEAPASNPSMDLPTLKQFARTLYEAQTLPPSLHETSAEPDKNCVDNQDLQTLHSDLTSSTQDITAAGHPDQETPANSPDPVSWSFYMIHMQLPVSPAPFLKLTPDDFSEFLQSFRPEYSVSAELCFDGSSLGLLLYLQTKRIYYFLDVNYFTPGLLKCIFSKQWVPHVITLDSVGICSLMHAYQVEPPVRVLSLSALWNAVNNCSILYPLQHMISELPAFATSASACLSGYQTLQYYEELYHHLAVKADAASIRKKVTELRFIEQALGTSFVFPAKYSTASESPGISRPGYTNMLFTKPDANTLSLINQANTICQVQIKKTAAPSQPEQRNLYNTFIAAVSRMFRLRETQKYNLKLLWCDNEGFCFSFHSKKLHIIAAMEEVLGQSLFKAFRTVCIDLSEIQISYYDHDL